LLLRSQIHARALQLTCDTHISTVVWRKHDSILNAVFSHDCKKRCASATDRNVLLWGTERAPDLVALIRGAAFTRKRGASLLWESSDPSGIWCERALRKCPVRTISPLKSWLSLDDISASSTSMAGWVVPPKGVNGCSTSIPENYSVDSKRYVIGVYTLETFAPQECACAAWCEKNLKVNGSTCKVGCKSILREKAGTCGFRFHEMVMKPLRFALPTWVSSSEYETFCYLDVTFTRWLWNPSVLLCINKPLKIIGLNLTDKASVMRLTGVACKKRHWFGGNPKFANSGNDSIGLKSRPCSRLRLLYKMTSSWTLERDWCTIPPR